LLAHAEYEEIEMSILSAVTGYVGFKVIDDAANAEVKNVTWVDDVNLEYEVLLPPASIYALGPYSMSSRSAPSA
jgi:hypothetical protein